MSNGTMAQEDFDRILDESGEGAPEGWERDESMAVLPTNIDQLESSELTQEEKDRQTEQQVEAEVGLSPRAKAVAGAAEGMSGKAEKRKLGTYTTPSEHREAVYGKV